MRVCGQSKRGKNTPAKGVGRVKSAAEVQILSSAPSKKTTQKWVVFLISTPLSANFCNFNTQRPNQQKLTDMFGNCQKWICVYNTVYNSFCELLCHYPPMAVVGSARVFSVFVKSIYLLASWWIPSGYSLPLCGANY